MAEFRLTSPAFDPDEDIPLEHTADDGDRSPPLEWTGVPEATKELILVVEDPDGAGVFTHWIVYAIAPEVTALPEGLPRDPLIDAPVELCQGLNEFDESGWTGPSGGAEERGPHRLFFRLHALDCELDVPPGITRAELRQAAKGHILATAELVGIA